MPRTTKRLLNTPTAQQPATVVDELGQELDAIEEQRNLANAERGMVTNQHWNENLSDEFKTFFDEFAQFTEQFRGAQKKKIDVLMDKFKHAASLQKFEAAVETPEERKAKKREKALAVAASNTHSAALTQGATAAEADAAVAAKLAAQEEKHAAELAAKLEELQEQHAVAAAAAAAAHEKELASKIEVAAEKAKAEVEERFTRNRAGKADAAAAEADAAAKAIASPHTEVDGSEGGEGGEAKSSKKGKKAKAAGLSTEMSEFLASKGVVIPEAALVASDKKAKKANKGKRKADADPDEEEEGGEGEDEGKKVTASQTAASQRERRLTAADNYKSLGIRGPAGLVVVIEQIAGLKGDKKELKQRLKSSVELNFEYGVPDNLIVSNGVLPADNLAAFKKKYEKKNKKQKVEEPEPEPEPEVAEHEDEDEEDDEEENDGEEDEDEDEE